ncbi:MAG TPA: SGNH/GDSL hydrolase family protein [Candidatus Dormibacteraeota bacterium]|nr:SGNH/GDSL hydrolase family protein [Candidatus Dormibacteraeota bacterium]
MNGHIALLGDSILDNGAYTEGGPDVVTHLRAMLPAAWRATLLALDGSLIGDLEDQLSDVPPDTTHVVVSIGGNNVAMNFDILRLRVRSEPEALMTLGYRVAVFESAYRVAINRVLSLGKEMAVCTIYNASLDTDAGAEALGLSTEDAAAALVMLTTFNDVILRVALEAKLRVIELRLVCTGPADYANTIEPSVQGGEKIARAIIRSFGLPSQPPIPAGSISDI